jgi:hypothetical protein
MYSLLNCGSVADLWHFGIFIIDLQDAMFFLSFFLHITFWRYIFKDKKSKSIHKQQKSRLFLLFLLDDGRIQEARKHVDPVDPDSDPGPQHWSADM